MGGSQSTPTRKLTIPNDGSSIIKVSESVAERLRKCSEQSPEEFIKKIEKENPPECPPSEFEKEVRNKENKYIYPGDPLMNFYYGPSVTSIRVLQEKEKELKESEEYWSARIKNMEQRHASYSAILENEYNKAVEQISTQTPRPPPNTPFPCYEQKEKLMKCYTKNPNEILLCAGEVTEFADCVHSKRIHANTDKKEDKENVENIENKENEGI